MPRHVSYKNAKFYWWRNEAERAHARMCTHTHLAGKKIKSLPRVDQGGQHWQVVREVEAWTVTLEEVSGPCKQRSGPGRAEEP